MVAQLIPCPACGAADTSAADARGLHVCVYCGARYKLGRGGLKASEGTPRAGLAAVIIGLGGLGIAGGLAAWFLMADRPPPEESLPGVLAPAPVSPVAPVEAPPSKAPPVPVVPPVAEVPPTPPLPVVVDVPDEAPASATFEEHSRRRAGGAIWVYGYVTNTSSFTIGKVKVSALLLDAAGEEVGADFSYSEWDGVAAGERSPITILINNPPKHERIEFIAYADKPSYLPAMAEGLEVEAKDPRRDKWMGWKTAGKVHNRGETPARFVRIDILGYDDDDKLIDIHSTYADAEILPPGASARFDASLFGSDRDFKRFEFYVRGQLAD